MRECRGRRMRWSGPPYSASYRSPIPLSAGSPRNRSTDLSRPTTLTRFLAVPKKGPPKRASQGVRGNSGQKSERVCELHATPERVAIGFAFAQLGGLVVQRIAQLGIREQLRHHANPGLD